MKYQNYLNCKSILTDKIYLGVEKLDKSVNKINAVSSNLQSCIFEETAKGEISYIYSDQNFRIVEIKKSIESHNPNALTSLVIIYK